MMEQLDCQRQPFIGAECGVYNETATGYLGRKRSTMLENPLLLRAEAAGQMRRRLTAPDNIPCDYTYGDMHRDFFNAGHATTGWAGIVKPHDSKKKKKAPEVSRDRDFLSMNRAAVAAGVATVKELRDFRDTHEALRPLNQQSSKPKEFRPPAKVIDKDAVYGKPPCPPNASVAECMSSAYRDAWIRSLPGRPAKSAHSEAKSKHKFDYTKYYQNRACDLRMFQCHTDTQTEPWKMPRFTRHAKPRLCTFRSCKAAQAAEANACYERPSRKGIYGQGIYTKPSNRRNFSEITQFVTERKEAMTNW